MLWQLPRETRSLDELAELSKVLSGQQWDSRGVIVTQDQADLLKAWEKLRAKSAKDFAVSEDDILNWHVREAESCEQEEQWSAAVFHWEALLKAKPDNKNYQDHLTRARDRLKSINNSPGR